MAKRSGARETNVELSCMWGLFSILQSCRCLESPKFISHGWPVGRHEIAHHPRKPPTSFDGECRKIRDEVESRRVSSFNGSVGSALNFLQEDSSIGESLTKQIVDKEQQHGETGSVWIHDLDKARQRARRHGEQALNRTSSFSGLDDAARLTDLPSSSAKESWNELAVAALLEAVSAEDPPGDGSLFERCQTNIHLSKHDPVRLQMSAKEAKSEPKSFSSSLEQLSLSKGRFIDLLPEPDSLLSRRFKNAKPSGTEKERIKSMLDAKLSEYMSKEASTSQKPGNSSTVRKAKTSKHSRQKIDYQCSCSPKKSSVCQPNDKIVILKPEPQNVKNFEYLTCNPTYLTLRETRKKLNRAFGSTGRESNQCSMNDDASDTVARSKSAFNGGDDSKRFSNSSTSLNMNGKVGKKKKKQDLKSNRGSDAGLSRNKEFDVVLEAKRRLSERLRKRNNVVDTRNVEQPLKTLQRILASPEHDFFLLSPRRNSQTPMTKENTCPSSLRLNVKPTDDDRKSSVMTATSPTDIESTNGQSAMVELGDVLGSESHKNDGCSVLDSVSENEASTSPADDFQSTQSSVYQSEVADSFKSQEHESPISVLEPYFIEDADCPQNTTLQTAPRELQPRRLDFEVRTIKPFPSNAPTSTASCTAEQDTLFDYVHLIMQASRLDWDQLATTWSITEELLPAALFDEMELLPNECPFDFKLLFDHINEVLIQIHRSHFCSRSPLLPGKPKSTSLAELVLHEITRQADFYLLPHTNRRTLDLLVSGNEECCTSWLDLQPDSEQIMADIADDFLEECILHILYESLT